jgi:hypothetical protein
VSSKLSDFYVGVVDFFAVLLPGALLCFLFGDSFLWHRIFAPVFPDIQEGIQQWAVFILASYLLGHFVFLVGSNLDYAYDFLIGLAEIQKGTRQEPQELEEETQETQKGSDKENSKSSFQDLLLKREAIRNSRDRIRRLLITSSDPAELRNCVDTFRRERLSNVGAPDVINNVQWARTHILLRYPDVAVELQRLEADSKFFRSLVVVLSIVSITALIEAAWLASAACIILTVLSFWGYLKRRWKSVSQTYTFYIASESIPITESDAAPKSVPDSADQAESS